MNTATQAGVDSQPFRIMFYLMLAVCCFTSCSAAETVYSQAAPGMPVYQIGPVQIDLSKRHDPQVVAPWRMVRPGIASPGVYAITGDTKINLILAGVYKQQSGVLRFDYEGSTQKPAAVAIWFELPRKRDTTCLLSNIATLGQPDPKRLPTIAAAKDAADFANKKKLNSPPAKVPAGLIALDRSHSIVPGMRIKAGWQAKWVDAEVLAIDHRGWVSVRYDDADKTIRMLPTFPAGEPSWFAAEGRTIAAARTNPRRFRPTVNVLPGTISVIPDGFVPLPPIDLPPGLPVKHTWANGWRDGWVLSSDATQAEIQSNFANTLSKHTVPRSTIVVMKQDAKRARSRASKRFYADKMAKEQAKVQ